MESRVVFTSCSKWNHTNECSLTTLHLRERPYTPNDDPSVLSNTQLHKLVTPTNAHRTVSFVKLPKTIDESKIVTSPYKVTVTSVLWLPPPTTWHHPPHPTELHLQTRLWHCPSHLSVSCTVMCVCSTVVLSRSCVFHVTCVMLLSVSGILVCVYLALPCWSMSFRALQHAHTHSTGTTDHFPRQLSPTLCRCFILSSLEWNPSWTLPTPTRDYTLWLPWVCPPDHHCENGVEDGKLKTLFRPLLDQHDRGIGLVSISREGVELWLILLYVQ